jgi:hypothetical protein
MAKLKLVQPYLRWREHAGDGEDNPMIRQNARVMMPAPLDRIVAITRRIDFRVSHSPPSDPTNMLGFFMFLFPLSPQLLKISYVFVVFLVAGWARIHHTGHIANSVTAGRGAIHYKA